MPSGSDLMRLLPAPVRPLIAGEAFGQLVRFAIAGLSITIFCAGIYLCVATVIGIDPMIATAISHVAGVLTGYAVHSRWSFRAEPGSEWAKFLRFASGSAGSFGLNSLWVWLAVHALHGPAWLPVPAMVFVTPLASFAINRYWVFGK